jgi:septal ring factor EnvC (AmiA/AmiB activator)
MMRRIFFAILLVLFLTPSAWSKFKEDEQKYLDDQFKAVLDQMQAMGNQVAALNAQLVEIKQNQAQLQAVIIRQQHQLQELDEMLSSLRIGNEENFSKLKTAIADLRTQTDSAISKLTGQQAAAAAGAAAEVPPVGVAAAPVASARPASQGYITAVDGTNVMIDMGSSQGVQQGSRLAVYKATDPNTRVGVVEVTQVVDSGNSRARIVTMNSGVKPEFSDVVRVE